MVRYYTNFPIKQIRPKSYPTPNTATYTVPNAKKDMEGSYLCRAKNAAGETEDLIQIIVNDNGNDGDGNRIGNHILVVYTNAYYPLHIILKSYYNDYNYKSVFILGGNCCRAMTAQCLACTLGQSIQQYCESNPYTLGCQGIVGNLVKVRQK